jgi:hypothetical protein
MLRNVTPGRRVNIYKLHNDTLKMETTGFFETSVYFYLTENLLALELINILP